MSAPTAMSAPIPLEKRSGPVPLSKKLVLVAVASVPALAVGAAAAPAAQEPRFYVELAIFTSVPLVFAFLHALLFVFSPRAKENLHFALLTTFFAGAAFLEFQMELTSELSDPQGFRVLFNLSRVLVFGIALTIGRIPYALRGEAPSRTYWTIVGAATLLCLVGFVYPRAWGPVLLLFLALWLFEVSRSSRRLRGLRDDLWIVILGFFLLLAGATLDLLMDLEVLQEPLFGTSNPWLYGGVGLLACLSVFLARSFARTNSDLARRLLQVQELSEEMLAKERSERDLEVSRRVLEADNRRKTEELEEARQLQLAMVPSEAPVSDDYELAGLMITATEVGGDYYDFAQDEDGSLIVAVGDAVGHGARAGALVAAIKGLFGARLRASSVSELIERFDEAILRMGLDRVFVALTLARLEGSRVTLACAGMPPPLYYEAKTDRVSEIPVGGTPLGSPLRTPAQVRDLELGSGDSLLLASDGFAELRLSEGGELGYDGARKLFREIAGSSADSIVQHLERRVRELGGNANPADDVTLVAIRRK